MSAAHSDALVFFGATGDLAYKKIFPSLQAMLKRDHLTVPVIGVAKSGWKLDQLRARARDSLEHHGGLDPAAFDKLCGLLRYVDDVRRAKELASRKINYVDVGTSGGVWGLERGYCMMIGGEPDVVKHLDPILATLAPGRGNDIPRSPGREKRGGTAEQGYLHCGPSGAGHFVKMVHNGIEYGIMAAYAEGLGVLRNANIGKRTHEIDAETTPLRDPEHYQYDLNLRDVAEVWRRGSVIASWLLDLTATSLVKDPELAEFAGRVSDSGEGRWTIKAAIDEAVPVPVLTTALYERFTSRGEADFQDKLLSAMRFQFGGHVEKK